MWLTPVPKDIVSTDKLKAVFGTTENVVPGQLYGSIEDGTGRMLFQPRTTHPGDHISREAIGDAIKWFQMTLVGGNGLDPSNQTWFWKEIGNLIAAIGMVILLIAVGAILLKTKFFGSLVQSPPASKVKIGIGWVIAALITMLLGPLTLFWFKEIPTNQEWPNTAIFPQEITNAVITWTTILGLITIVLLLIWHFAFSRKAGGNGDDYGLTWGGKLAWGKIGKSLLFSFLVVLAGYITLLLTDFFFKTDYRFWVFAIKLFSPLQLRIAVIYFFPLLFYFFLLNVVIFAQLRTDRFGLVGETVVNVLILILGYAALLLVQYIPLLAGGTLFNPGRAALDDYRLPVLALTDHRGHRGHFLQPQDGPRLRRRLHLLHAPRLDRSCLYGDPFRFLNQQRLSHKIYESGYQVRRTSQVRRTFGFILPDVHHRTDYS